MELLECFKGLAEKTVNQAQTNSRNKDTSPKTRKVHEWITRSNEFRESKALCDTCRFVSEARNIGQFG